VTPLPELLENVDGAVGDLRGTFQANRGKVEEIVAGLRDSQRAVQELIERLNAVVAENRPNIRASVEGTRRTIAQAERAAAEVRTVIADVKEVTAEFDTLADTLEQTLRHSEGATAHARGILESNRPVLEDLVRDLRAAAENAREFTRILSEEPQAVLRGHEPQGRIGE
jgi:ABC-type transporter Mla subunit MlaD